ncbi:WG repeat-containing protein, partial [Nostoc sp. NIES-2111]
SGCANGQAEEATCLNQEKSSAQIQVLKPEQKPLFRIVQNGKLGFIDNTGRIVIKPKFELDKVGNFSENRAALGGKNGKWGFIDNTGKVIVLPQFENVAQFSEQRAAVKQNGKWGFIDLNGKIVVKPQFNNVSLFIEQRSAVQKGYLWGFIDRDGKFIVEPKFTGYTNFSEGLAGFESYENNQDKSGFIDTSGRVVIELKNVNPDIEGLGFTNGLAPVWVRNPGIWGIINGILDETGRGRKFWGFINRSGQITIPLKYDYAFNFQDCLAAVV